MKTAIYLSVTVSMALSLAFALMVENSHKKKDKSMSFECGFEPLSESKTTFSTNFIMLMLMFLIFDVEISILIPFLVMNKNNQTMAMMASSVLIMFLCVLTLKEWKQGSLEWAK